MSLSRNPSVLASAVGHFSVDMYSGMLPMMLLVLSDPLSLSYGQIGLVSMTFGLASSLSQPVFGWLGDKKYSRLLAVLGVATVSVNMGLLRFSDRFAMLFILATLAGLGAGAFHPQGAVLAADTEVRSRGSAMSLYMLGGNIGYAFGPLISAAIFSLAGSSMPLMVAALGLAQAGIVFWAISRRPPAPNRSIAARESGKRAAISIMIIVALVLFLRSWVQTSIQTFIPQLYKGVNADTSFAGQVLFSILMPLAIGGLIGGTLSDRVGRRWVLAISTAIVGPALWGLLTAQGAAVLMWGPLLGIAMGASLPVSIVMVQELVPRGLGLMSGVALGFSFIAGSIGVSLNGFAADHMGLMPVMMLNPLLVLAASALAFLLPPDQPGTRSH